jgi:hypothetical protein
MMFAAKSRECRINYSLNNVMLKSAVKKNNAGLSGQERMGID